MAYKGAIGHNNTGGLANLVGQGRSNGIQYPETFYAGDDRKVRRGEAFIVIHFDVLDDDEFVALMTQLGLDAALNSDVTLFIPNEFRVFGNYNGVAQLPDPEKDYKHDTYYRDVNLSVTGLEAI